MRRLCSQCVPGRNGKVHCGQSVRGPTSLENTSARCPLAATPRAKRRHRARARGLTMCRSGVHTVAARLIHCACQDCRSKASLRQHAAAAAPVAAAASVNAGTSAQRARRPRCDRYRPPRPLHLLQQQQRARTRREQAARNYRVNSATSVTRPHVDRGRQREHAARNAHAGCADAVGMRRGLGRELARGI